MRPDGVIVGGWQFVVASYAVAASVLVAYASLLVFKLRRQSRDAAEPAGSRRDADHG